MRSACGPAADVFVANCRVEQDVVELDGDGITTSASALNVPGADQLVLDGVKHMPHGLMGHLVTPEASRERPWYGSESTLDEWLPWLQGRH